MWGGGGGLGNVCFRDWDEWLGFVVEMEKKNKKEDLALKFRGGVSFCV